ncbi:MAG: hypothetical protein KJ686_01325 [Actinobacteria bacterium]|nr:hypothetical protein [Actinomycetota bacterium]
MWLEGDIIKLVLKKERITLEDAKQLSRHRDELAQRVEGKAKVLADAGTNDKVDRDARVLVKESLSPEKYGKVAMVFNNPVQRLVNSFFLGLQRLNVTARAFGGTEDAEVWLKE